MPWPSISAAPSPISSPTITTAAQVVYTKSPTTYGNFVDGILDCFAQGEARSAGRELRQSRHDAGHQLADPAQGRQGRAGHHHGLPRRARDRARQPARPVRSALPARRAADPARRCASRSPSASAARARSSRRSTSPRSTPLAEKLKALRHRGGRDLLHELLRQSGARGAAPPRRCARCCPDVYVTYSTELTREWYEYERTSTVAANAYVGPQVNDLRAPPRKRSRQQGLRRLAVHDGLERRPALGRAHLPAAGRAGRVRPDRRLHRRRRLCGGARLHERHRLRHGRHDGEMRAGRERPLLGRIRSTTPAAT